MPASARRASGLRNAARILYALLALAGSAARYGHAMIDPSFTPVHLVEESRAILAGRLAESKEGELWTLAEPRALKGERAGPPQFSLALDRAEDAKAARELLRSCRGSEAMLFQGRYWGTEPGLLLVRDAWMRLKLVGGTRWQITGHVARMRKTYPGAADKLLEMVEYILRDEEADVPVSVGVKWRKRLLAARVPGQITRVAALPSGPKQAARLFVASPSGDRIFEYAKGLKAFEDRSGAARLDTASKAFAFVDLNSDGQADLVSWDGARLKVRLGRQDGTFEAPQPSSDLEWRGACSGLAVLSPSQDGSPGLLLSAEWPQLLTWKAGGWGVTPLPGRARPEGRATSEACVVADWDGDGYTDVLQLRGSEGLLWKGKAEGFEEPRLCGVKSGGSPARWCVGDFDTDGRLDLFVSGSESCELWENAGEGSFLPVIRYTGSLQDKRQPGAADCLATDLNHDGRPDLAFLYEEGRFFYHFNRGYRCMGEEGELRAEVERPPGAPRGSPGPVRAVAGDLDGDGALDLAVAFATGEVFAFLSDLSEAHGLWIRLPRGHTGPVAVSVWQGATYPVCVGTHLVEGHSPPTHATLRRPGPCTLKWRWPGGPPRVLETRDGADVVLPCRAPAP